MVQVQFLVVRERSAPMKAIVEHIWKSEHELSLIAVVPQALPRLQHTQRLLRWKLHDIVVIAAKDRPTLASPSLFRQRVLVQLSHDRALTYLRVRPTALFVSAKGIMCHPVFSAMQLQPL